MDPIAFTHLHVHTEYSLLDGSCKIQELVSYAKELGMKHLAITDHGVMFGAVEFYKACEKEGIHPIIGCEVYVARKSRFAKEGRSDAGYFHLVLLAENQTGYQNLIKLVSKGFTEGYYYKPRVDLELLKEYHEGIIALSACLAGVVARPLLDESYEAAKAAALEYAEIFGPDHFYLELQDHGIPEQRAVNQGLIRMAEETGLELVATNDVHYTYEKDREAHDILLCIQTGKKVDDPDRLRYEPGFYLKSQEEMAALFPYVPQAISNTEKIAERCKVKFVFHELKLPRYDVPDGKTAQVYLRELCEAGMHERYSDDNEEAWKRLQYELETIETMGYVDYFLIVWDFIHYAKTHGIMVGPGRGSAAGSVVAYCLDITTLDPLKYDLVFERFLNIERVTMPDIDVDFCYRRRQEVIDYVNRKYGEDCVAQIVTFGTMAARLVIRDVGRAMDLSYGEVDKIAKMIPTALGITIDKALDVNSELKEAYEESPQIHHLIDMSKRLEGLPRHCSTHAAGVVISGRPVDEYVPLNANDGNVTTQFTMTTLEELGLLKMDFLGLRTLTVIQDAIDMIRKTENIEIDLRNLPMDDPEVYQMIASGKTEGVFQLESAGMTSFMRELRPENLEDIIAGVALYRPGPMDFIPNYIKSKRGGQSEYRTPELEPILKNTYGCIVYQEQVMQIVRDLAGYTMGRSDLVRRAMSKKKAEVMAKEREYFIYGNEEMGVPGCVARGISEEAANGIFDDMVDFAKYAFNKAHSAAYAVVTYQTAWLKCHYPVEFMAALMTSVIDHPGKVIGYIQSLKSMNIELLPPDINEGEESFTVSKANGQKKIRYALSAIKNVGHSVVDQIAKERQENGAYVSMTDFCRRMQDFDLNKRGLENLIKAGCFDSLGGTRSVYMRLYPTILSSAIQWKKVQISGQMDLFGMSEDSDRSEDLQDPFPKTMTEWEDAQRLANEKEVLGLYLTGHPMAEVEELWRQRVTHFSSDFIHVEEDEEKPASAHPMVDGMNAVIGGIVTQKTVKTTKNNKQMAFLTIEDLYGSVEVLVFPATYDKLRGLIEEDQKVFISGRISLQVDEDAKMILQDIVPIDAAGVDTPEQVAAAMYMPMQDIPPVQGHVPVQEEPSPEGKPVWLRFVSSREWEALKEDVIQRLSMDPGDRPVRIFLEAEKQRLRAPSRYNVSGSEDLKIRLSSLIGQKNVVF